MKDRTNKENLDKKTNTNDDKSEEYPSEHFGNFSSTYEEPTNEEVSSPSPSEEENEEKEENIAHQFQEKKIELNNSESNEDQSENKVNNKKQILTKHRFMGKREHNFPKIKKEDSEVNKNRRDSKK